MLPLHHVIPDAAMTATISSQADTPVQPRRAMLAATQEPAWVRVSLILLALSFLTLFLFVPLATVFYEALKKGWDVYLAAVTDPDAASAVKLTLVAAAISLPLAQSANGMPVGMMLGADVSLSTWWLWNQIPVTLGNLVGGMLFTGLAIYAAHHATAPAAAPAQVPAQPVTARSEQAGYSPSYSR